MPVLEEIAAKLEALGLGTQATSLFLGEMPDSPDACCAVYEYPGKPPDETFGSTAISREYPSIQVVFRGAKSDYSGPRAMAETACAGLNAVQLVTLSAGGGGTSALYHWIHPKQPPFFLKRDEIQRVYIACNYEIEKEPSA